MTGLWEILRTQARKFRTWGQVLKDAKHIEGNFNLAHMAVELICKSAIARRDPKGEHPIDTDSHQLRNLLSRPKTNFIAVDMAGDINSNVHRSFVKVTSENRAWKMQYRYKGTTLSPDDMSHSVDLYEESFQWIEQKYVQ